MRAALRAPVRARNPAMADNTVIGVSRPDRAARSVVVNMPCEQKGPWTSILSSVTHDVGGARTIRTADLGGV
jgi:hypothetical protein